MAVSLLLSDMETFQDVNRSYVSNFAINPPIRVCVEAPIETKVSLSAIGNCKSPIKTMHVQSISHWAPANIGPYSQATLVSGYQIKSNLTLRIFLVTAILVLKVNLFLSWQFIDLIWLHWSLVIWFLKPSWLLS